MHAPCLAHGRHAVSLRFAATTATTAITVISISILLAPEVRRMLGRAHSWTSAAGCSLNKGPPRAPPALKSVRKQSSHVACPEHRGEMEGGVCSGNACW